MSDRVRRGAIVALLLFSLAAFAGLSSLFVGSYRERARQVAARQLKVTVVNVGHGVAAWLKAPGGEVILIGAGPQESGPKVVSSLRAAGVKQIDLLVLPYPYAEAVGGVPAVVDAFPVTKAIEPGGPQRVNQAQEAAHARLDAANVPIQTVHTGDQLDVGGATVDVLAPPDPLLTASPTAANNSLVLRVGWGETGFLFAGGIERAGEDSLIAAAGDRLSSNWLQVARFGTREASSPELLRLVSPEYAVVSVGTPNSGDYPHPETLDRLRESGARVYRTDESQDAELTFISDGAVVTAPK